jgi:hypothetical protein
MKLLIMKFSLLSCHFIPFRTTYASKEHGKFICFVRFEVFTAVTMKNAVFWDEALCRSCVNGRSSETSVHAKSTQRRQCLFVLLLVYK